MQYGIKVLANKNKVRCGPCVLRKNFATKISEQLHLYLTNLRFGVACKFHAWHTQYALGSVCAQCSVICCASKKMYAHFPAPPLSPRHLILPCFNYNRPLTLSSFYSEITYSRYLKEIYQQKHNSFIQ